MNINRIRRTDRFYDPQVNKLDLPMLAGSVKMTLKNVHNGKTEVFEKHNAPTNALAHIFAGNYGGLMNYQNFEDLYRTWLGGVLVFGNPLDTSAVNDYGIPAYTSNPVRAHAGQTPLTDQADDLTRGNPDSSRTVTTAGSTKLVFEWGTSAGNGVISSLGLTHSDVGSFGAGVVSQAQQSLNPFAEVGSVSRSYAYGDNANCVLAINGNMAYNVYLTGGTELSVYKTPINNTKFKLQGGSLLPLTDYTTKITATLSNSYNTSIQAYYYWFDFNNNKLILFGVPNEGGTTLYRDDIDLDDGTVTHQTITVTGANLWKFTTGNQNQQYALRPTKAMVYNNHLYVYGYTSVSSNPDKLFIINLSNTADITEVDTSDFPDYNFAYRIDSFDGMHRINERFTALGGIIAHRSFLINGDKLFRVADRVLRQTRADLLATDGIIAPNISMTDTENMISVCKLYLATKFNLDAPVTKTSAQSMTVEYTLTEV